ncbi:type II toxin-antitoxin system BrnA family antitoxin [Jiella avicenniae]|uniref:Ribbon-helix-helix protein, CopG family n=1 Tax=Jiella avicenniae TaxID=2907202 RepID=A0A9X1T6M4_9HYPH|nr:ribbon-helix-helix protein, CopG family [Jiella avicenniae]MCE7030776.1 ribbon-helix-helix protein, CopG family [Jiella avicenniae]
MKAHEFDRIFDDGGSVDEAIDWTTARRPNQPATRLSVELPHRLSQALDREAERVGLTREEVIRALISDHLA